jgi:8-oxo-dGTP pyrophosphatase MutT (NUDIX family)
MGAVGVLFDDSGRVLLVRHTYGRLNWELPGGGSEPGESPDETAIREIREETGLDVEIERLTGIYYEAEPRPGTSQGPLLHFAFKVRRTDHAQSPLPSSAEIGELGWWPPDALPGPISDFTERRVRDARHAVPAQLGRIGHRIWRT